MLALKNRIESFHRLGLMLKPELEAARSGSASEEFEAVLRKTEAHNPWFTRSNQLKALAGIAGWLDKEELEKWLTPYDLSAPEIPLKVAVIMAGNIPLVNFHDYLSVLITGHRFMGKLSSQDRWWLPYITSLLISTDKAWEHEISFTEGTISGFDAIIATGSTNTSRYFEYYFGKYPNIIRKNRNSVAVITGAETPEELALLGEDVFSYYGLGCRNVSKVYLPENYPVSRLLDAFMPWQEIAAHHKYTHNYDYQKAILLVNNDEFMDTGFLVVKPSESIASPVSVLYTGFYESSEAMEAELSAREHEIQCIVRKEPVKKNEVCFGSSQKPGLSDYPDGVDIIGFLKQVKR